METISKSLSFLISCHLTIPALIFDINLLALHERGLVTGRVVEAVLSGGPVFVGRALVQRHPVVIFLSLFHYQENNGYQISDH